MSSPNINLFRRVCVWSQYISINIMFHLLALQTLTSRSSVFCLSIRHTMQLFCSSIKTFQKFHSKCRRKQIQFQNRVSQCIAIVFRWIRKQKIQIFSKNSNCKCANSAAASEPEPHTITVPAMCAQRVYVFVCDTFHSTLAGRWSVNVLPMRMHVQNCILSNSLDVCIRLCGVKK